MSEGFNRISNYQDLPDDNNDDAINLQDVDMILFSQRFKLFLKKIAEESSSKDPNVVNIANAMMSKDFFQSLNRELGDKLSDLMDKSEELIDSPDANTPEVVAQRKEVAAEIDKVMEMQDEIRPMLASIDYSEALIHSSDPNSVKEAKDLIEKMKKEFGFVVDPNQGGMN